MTDLEDLIARVSAATEPSIDLFIRVAASIDPVAYPGRWVGDQEAADWRFNRFEKFLGAGAWEQAALSLMERCLPGWTWSVGNLRVGAQAYLMRAEGAQLIGGPAASPALALILAMLRALQGTPSPLSKDNG